MKVITLKEVPIDKLSLPGNWNKILKDPEVPARAASIATVGLIHEPVVRKKDMRLLAGRRRVAAHVHAGKKTVMVKLIDCSDEECLIIEQAENAERTHDPKKQAEAQSKLVELLTKKIASEEEVREGGPGRGKSAKGKAREMVAQSRGVKPEAVRRAEYRERKRREQEGKPPVPTPAIPPEAEPAPVRNFKIALAEEFVRDVKAVQAANNGALLATRKALRELKEIQETAGAGKLELFPEVYGPVVDLLNQAIHKLKELHPSSVCPTCKGVPEITPECGQCKGLAYITKSQERLTPPELMNEDDPVVYHQGKKVPLADFDLMMESDFDPFA